MAKSKRAGHIEMPAATRLARVFPDHPLEDQKLAFEFDGFARTLAELAWNPDNTTPFTVVVRGGWGRGKTTLLKRAKWMMDHPGELELPPPEGIRTVRTLWFNAWKYPDDDTVLAGLLGAAIDGLQRGGKLDQLKLLVDSYKSEALKTLLSLAAPAALREKILGEGWTSKYDAVHEKRAFHDTFRPLFNQVSRLLFDLGISIRDSGGLPEELLWNEENQRREVLAVFLDDLDRCRRERVVEVIEAINLFLDLPGVCFFLGTDWERLVTVLPGTIRKEDADQFLEKVVQVAFDLPEVSPDGTHDYVAGLLRGTELETVLGGDGEGASEDVQILARVLETLHPRHVKRFLNDLSVTLAVLRNTGKLGTGDEQLTEETVVSWHLLSELLPRDEWRELRALPQNLDRFLQQAETLVQEKAGAEPSEDDDEPAHWSRLRTSGLAERHLELLRSLSKRQRYLLVYFATPPAVEAPAVHRARGRRNLFDLSSDAWVDIPSGDFLMGAQSGQPDEPGFDKQAHDDESPIRRVTLSPFRLARYPVTNGEYAVYVEETGKEPPTHWEAGRIPDGKVDHPVVEVSWTDAVAFARWLSKKTSEEDEETIRLPTEAQWEFAARGSEGRRFPWGSDEPDDQRANFDGQVGDTTPVGSYPDSVTPEGVHDLAGNVLEWCGDFFGPYPSEPEPDPTGPASGSSRVLRGGSFGFSQGFLRAASRFHLPPGSRGGLVGFRLCVVGSRGL